MTDTVKLIIEIPKEKELIDKAIWNDVSDFDTEDLAIILIALKNGVPLDDVKALEQDPCEDCISREYILSKAHECRDDLADDEPCCVDADDIREAPSVQPKAKVGHNCNDEYADCDQFVCSECGIELQDWNRVERDEDGYLTYHEYTMRFCPNCGAKMESEGKE